MENNICPHGMRHNKEPFWKMKIIQDPDYLEETHLLKKKSYIGRGKNLMHIGKTNTDKCMCVLGLCLLFPAQHIHARSYRLWI